MLRCIIEEIAPLDAEISNQTQIVRSGDPAVFPKTLPVRFADPSGFTDCEVSWDSDADHTGGSNPDGNNDIRNFQNPEKKTFQTANKKSASLTIIFSNDWWKVTGSAWRIVASESPEGTAFTSSTITVKIRRYYQNPSKYIQIRDKIKLKHFGSYNLKMEYMGLKVRKVNNYFHIGT